MSFTYWQWCWAPQHWIFPLADNLGLCSWTGALLKAAKFPTGLIVIFGLQVKMGHFEFYFGFGKAQCLLKLLALRT